MMSCWPSIRPAFLLVPMLALASVVPAQDWECIQVLNDGSVDLGWAPDTQGAAAYSVVPLLPPPDYTPLPATDYDLATYPTGVNWPLLTTTQEFCFCLLYTSDAADDP